MAELLSPFISDPALLAVWNALPSARLVGGCVRDALAGRPVADIDFATPEPPDAVMRALRRAGLRAVPTGLAHGTVTAVGEGRGFEITTLRRDAETDGRHAQVQWTDDWREDAARRDFTFNAMFLARDGTLSDFFAGMDDLRAGHVRFVGDPALRIAEDYLRILRFFRFHARYGRGAPDQAALDAITSAAPRLNELSAERIWHELRRILAAPDPAGTLRCMAECGVLTVLIPEGFDVDRLARMAATGAPADPILRLAALLAGDEAGRGGAMAARLRFSGAERDELQGLLAAPVLPVAGDQAVLRRALADWPGGVLIRRSWLAEQSSTQAAHLRARLADLPRPVFPLSGRDAVSLGAMPGPALGALLRGVREWWLAGGCVADGEACRAELARRVRD